MSCVVEKDCKAAEDIKQRGFDLSWYAGRKWRPGMYVASGTAIRVRPQSLGGEQPTTGWQYRANASGWTGEVEPSWPTDTTPVDDGSLAWIREAVTSDSLEKTISGAGNVTWDADSPMTATNPVLVTTGGQLVITAHHAGGLAGTRRSTWADVTFSDATADRFEIQWKVT
jgi:hypothetical protein